MRKFLLLGIFGLTFFAFRHHADPNRYFEITKNIELFTNIYKELNYYYVDDIEPGQLMKVGVDAMLNSLDPYTNYFSEAQVENYRFLTEGKYHGIGAGIKIIDGLPTITELFDESPAYKSGLILGDQLITIGGKSVKGKSKEEINTLMQGAADSNLDLVVKRPGDTKDFSFSVVRGEVDQLVESYGHVIVDECHHIGAASFEGILKRVKAKYVLGLTATPFRRDGQQPIIFMQCGPIRHTAARATNAPHDLVVVPHMLTANIALPSDAGIQEVFSHLANDSERTRTIAADIIAAFREGRKVLVLTERTEHLQDRILS